MLKSKSRVTNEIKVKMLGLSDNPIKKKKMVIFTRKVQTVDFD